MNPPPILSFADKPVPQPIARAKPAYDPHLASGPSCPRCGYEMTPATSPHKTLPGRSVQVWICLSDVDRPHPDLLHAQGVDRLQSLREAVKLVGVAATRVVRNARDEAADELQELLDELG